MLARKIHYLRHFGLGNFVSEDSALADPVMMNMQHDLGCCFNILLEESLQNMNDELHRRIIVVQDQNAIQARPLRARLRLGDNGRTRPGPVRTSVVLGHAGGKERAAVADLSGLSGRRSQRLVRHGVAFDDPRPAAARMGPRWRIPNMAPVLLRRKPTGKPYPSRNTGEIHTFRETPSSHLALRVLPAFAASLTPRGKNSP